MARKKVDLKYIVNDAKRKASLKKRKFGLIKKVEEISTLCGVDACAIVYTPNEPEPEVWPSPWETRRVISRFMQMPELDQNRKMQNQESFLRQRVQKTEEQLKKVRNENRKKEMNQLMYQCLSVGEVLNSASMVDLNDLAWVIDQNLKDIGTRIRKLEGQEGAAHGKEAINGDQAQVEAMQVQQPCLVNNDIIHGGDQGFDDEVQVQPFGDVAVNLQNGYWSSPFNP